MTKVSSSIDSGKNRRRDFTVPVLLGPCVIYLAIFAIFPLVYSLRLSLTDLTADAGSGQWVGLRNYKNLVTVIQMQKNYYYK